MTDWHQIDWSPWLEAPARAGAFMDFDGTLAEIVDDRDQAVPVPGALEVIAALADRYAVVAVISGRPVEFLASVLGCGPSVVLVGLYGIERLSQGRLSVLEEAAPWKAAVAHAVAEAKHSCPAGLDVEDKGLSVALHSRRSPGTFTWARAWAQDRVTTSGLVAHWGRLSVELVPPVPVDKGAVVEQLSAQLAAACFFGDDTGDVPAFRALRSMRRPGKATVAIGIGSEEQPEELVGSVDLLLSGPSEAVEVLRALVV